MNNTLYKLHNTETGEDIYCMRPSHVAYGVGSSNGAIYTILRKGSYKEWEITEVDGTNIPYGEIWKP